jgi:hypothetical protein
MSPRRARVAPILRRFVPFAGISLVAALGLNPAALANSRRAVGPGCGFGWQRISSPNPSDIHSSRLGHF